MSYSTNLWNADEAVSESPDWTFATAATRDLTHCYHDYPARMIPQVAGKLLNLYAPNAKLMLDPYCGSGTSLVEGMVRGINIVGVDLNPLACLIAKAKTSTPDPSELKSRITEMEKFIRQSKSVSVPERIAGISRLDFWFKPHVIEKLSALKCFIDERTDGLIRLFFQVAFSETVRESSNTRNEEFKLYRYETERLERFEPDVFGMMATKLQRNLAGLHGFLARLRKLEAVPRASIYELDSTSNIFDDVVPQESVDIVVTSPPYGDSHTTVAYGQYSRLSSAWLELPSPEKTDRKLMGGGTRKSVAIFPSIELNQAIESIRHKDEKRACEVASFYSHLEASIARVSCSIKRGGHACYVVGNRKVKGITLPTDAAIRCFFEQHGFAHANTFQRWIPNKRMPLRNSPTNAAGVVEKTMTDEEIVVMRCEK
ncbi:MAG: DNA methyltransferase [Pyrinomonadaceae bacterium]